MSKSTLFQMAIAAFNSIDNVALKQGMVDRIIGLADTLETAGFKKKPAVKAVNALKTQDWVVNAQNISLAWAYLNATEDEKENALKPIEALASELLKAIPNELEKQAAAKEKADQLAEEKAAADKKTALEKQQKEQQKNNPGAGDGDKKGKKGTGDNPGDGDVKTYAISEFVGTVKYKGRYLSGEVELTADEADDLAAFLD